MTPTADKKSWQDRRTVRLMVLSASQFEEADTCIRQWWLHRVRGLKKSKKHSQTFGTVIHAVTERFLAADNLGRDPQTGAAVELFPPGWTKAEERWAKVLADGEEAPPVAEVTPAEADVIQRLIKEAIESGVLERLGTPEDRDIEVEFREEVISLPCPKCEGSGNVECPNCKLLGNYCGGDHDADEFSIPCDLCNGDGKGDRIQVTGFIDYALPAEIQDHKSTSAMKWAKSKEALRKNIQMLIYAHALLMKYTKAGKPLPEKIALRHNVYCKDPNDLRVRKTEAYVTPEEVETFWAGLVERAKQMSQLRRTANGWHDCPPPASMGVCQMYGGCDYRGICGGFESEEKYEKRLDTAKALSHTTTSQHLALIASNMTPTTVTTSPIQKEQPMSEVMSFAQKIAARNKAALGAVTGSGPLTVVAAPAPVQAPVQAPAPAATATGTPGPVVRAPWANVTCPACKGLGFNTAGTPCPICDIKTKQTGIPKSSDYDLTPMGDGSVYWVLKADRNKEGVSPMVANGAVPVVAETRVQAPAPVAPAPAPVEAPAPAGVPVIAGTPITPAVAPAEVPATPTPATRGRKKARFTLLLNVVASKGEKATTRLYDVFLDAQKTMAQASGKESFYDLDPFQRRDEFLRAGEAIAEKLGNDDVTADLASASPDFKAFIEAVRPYCDREFIAA